MGSSSAHINTDYQIYTDEKAFMRANTHPNPKILVQPYSLLLYRQQLGERSKLNVFQLANGKQKHETFILWNTTEPRIKIK